MIKNLFALILPCSSSLLFCSAQPRTTAEAQDRLQKAQQEINQLYKCVATADNRIQYIEQSLVDLKPREIERKDTLAECLRNFKAFKGELAWQIRQEEEKCKIMQDYLTKAAQEQQ